MAAGPVAGLQTDGQSAAAIWFHNCTFGNSLSAVPGDVSVDSSACHVFSNTDKPTVWDFELSKEVDSWFLAPAQGSATGSGPFQDRAFLTEADAFFVQAANDQAAATGLQRVESTPLPDRAQFIAQDPYRDSDSGKLKVWWVAAPLAAVLVVGLVVVSAVLVRRHHVKKRMEQQAADVRTHHYRSYPL